MKNLLATIFVLFSLASYSQNKCNTANLAFKDGEQLNYIIDYNWGIIRMNAGEAASNIFIKKINGNNVYHFSTQGKSFPQYNWFFKVHDKYESYADTFSLKPFRFIREVHEDKYYAYDDYIFNHRNTRVYTTEKRNNKEISY